MKMRNKKIPVFVWIMFGVLVMAGIGYATTTISDTSSSMTSGQLTIVRPHDSEYGLFLKANSSEESVAIQFWEHPTSTNAKDRLAQIVAHGNATGSMEDELAFYTTSSTGVMTNRMKFLADIDVSPLLLISTDNIAMNSGGTLYLGKTFTKANGTVIPDQVVRIGGKLQVMSGIDAYDGVAVNITDELRIGTEETGDVFLYWWNAGRSAYDALYIDKASYPGLGATGFRFNNNVYTDNNLTVSSTGLFKMVANTTGLGCSSTTAGSIYYDGSLATHMGCNGTEWRALY